MGAENLDIRVVLHRNGLAVLMYPDEVEGTKKKRGNATEDMQTRITGLKNQGVRFHVCANTLKGRNINLEEDLHDATQDDVVPSGVAELANLQIQGYTYIKPRFYRQKITFLICRLLSRSSLLQTVFLYRFPKILPMEKPQQH